MLLMEPGKLHVLADDLESFVHVLTWTCIRYARYGRDRSAVLKEVDTVYNALYNEPTGIVTGGDAKVRALMTGRHLISISCR